MWFDAAMAKAFYRMPGKEIQKAVAELAAEGMLVSWESGYLLKSDAALLEDYEAKDISSVYALHRNDILFKSREPLLKQMVKDLTEGLSYDCEPLQYLLIDGRFCGASVGHFRYGPYDLNDIVCSLPDPESRREEILTAVLAVNPGGNPLRFGQGNIGKQGEIRFPLSPLSAGPCGRVLQRIMDAPLHIVRRIPHISAVRQKISHRL